MIWAVSWQNLLMLYTNNKDAHPSSLISAFVVRFLDSIIPVLALPKYTRLSQASANFSLTFAHLRRQVFSWHGFGGFTSFSTVFQLYQDDGRLIVKVLCSEEPFRFPKNLDFRGEFWLIGQFSIVTIQYYINWTRAQQNQQNNLCAQGRLRS